MHRRKKRDEKKKAQEAAITETSRNLVLSLEAINNLKKDDLNAQLAFHRVQPEEKAMAKDDPRKIKGVSLYKTNDARREALWEAVKRYVARRDPERASEHLDESQTAGGSRDWSL